jgi:glutamine synthetase
VRHPVNLSDALLASAAGQDVISATRRMTSRHSRRTSRLSSDAGLRVTAANHECSPGQFEINLGHSDLVDAADRSFRLSPPFRR